MAELNNLKYKKEYCEMLVKHMSTGMSFESFASNIYDLTGDIVGRSTLYNWEKQYPEFAEAKALGFERALKFFERRATIKASGQTVEGINSKDIDTTMLIFMMKTRFHKIYGDKVQHELQASKVEINISKDESGL